MAKHLRRCLIFLSTKAAYQEADHCVGEHPHISSSSELSLGCACERAQERGVPESWIHVCRTNKAGRLFRFHRPFGLYFRWQSDRWQSRLVLPSWRNSSSTCAKGKKTVSRVEEQRALGTEPSAASVWVGNLWRKAETGPTPQCLLYRPLPGLCIKEPIPVQSSTDSSTPPTLFKGHQSLYLSLLWASSDIVLQCLRLQCWAL